MSMVTIVSRPALPALLGMLLLGACAPQDMETQPVKVETAKGTVVCQLYTHDIVYWDRSIARPDSMTTKEGDAICLEEGRKQKQDMQL
jgi:hypothetical protein